MKRILWAGLLLLGACSEGGEGKDCSLQGATCPAGQVCRELSAGKHRCIAEEYEPSGPFLKIEPAELVFPKTAPGNSDSRIVLLSQAGELPLTISNVTLEGAEGCDAQARMLPVNAPELADECDFIMETHPAWPKEVLVGDQGVQVRIRIQPRTDDPPPVRLLVESDDVRRPVLGIDVRMQGDQPRISVSDSRVTFTATGEEQTAELTVSNVGRAPLNVSRVWIEPDPSPAVVDDPMTPWTLEPQESRVLTVRYTPDGSAASADLWIESNDLTQPRTQVVISSEAAAAELVIEPAELSFGAAGEMQTLLLRNDSRHTEVIAILDMHTEPAEAWDLGTQDTMVTLRSEQTREVTVTFSPTGDTSEDGALLIQSNAGNADAEGWIRVPLRDAR